MANVKDTLEKIKENISEYEKFNVSPHKDKLNEMDINIQYLKDIVTLQNQIIVGLVTFINTPENERGVFGEWGISYGNGLLGYQYENN